MDWINLLFSVCEFLDQVSAWSVGLVTADWGFVQAERPRKRRVYFAVCCVHCAVCVVCIVPCPVCCVHCAVCVGVYFQLELQMISAAFVALLCATFSRLR